MTARTQEEWAALAGRVFTPNYRPAPLVFQRGDGVWLYDSEDRRFLDFAAGIAVCALGHGHPAMVKAISDQARDLLHVSNLYLNQPSIALAEKLVHLSFADRVYFANSGTEANEAALKMARRFTQVVKGLPEKSDFICATDSFHGRTWAAISATGQPKYHKGFGPLVPGFKHVPYNDLAAVEAAIDERTCAVFMEPIQGEGGVVVPDEGYLEGLRRLCDVHGALLILDEVQTGIGRTGRWFAYEHSRITPDICTLAKGLGGGVPIGAMLCTDEVAEGFQPGVHASTFGGNPLVCQTSLAVLNTIESDGLLAHCTSVGDHFGEGLARLVDATPGLLSARGRGLMRGLGVDNEVIDRAAVVASARDKGLLMTTAGPDALRFVPPLIAGPAHVDEAIDILQSVFAELSS